jgi:entericidin B
LIALALVAVLGLSACNTMRGIGQDVQKAGSAIEDAAKKK